MEWLNIGIAWGDQLNEQCLEFLKEKIIRSHRENPDIEVDIYISLGDILWEGNWFCFLSEEDAFWIHDSIRSGKKYRTKDELIKLMKKKWRDDELIPYLQALEAEWFIKQATYIYYWNSYKKVNWKTVSEYYHLQPEDVKLNAYSSLFRKGFFNTFIESAGKRIEMEEVLPEEYFVTKQLLLFWVGYYRLELTSSFLREQTLTNTKSEEIYQISNTLIVNVSARTFSIGGITRKVRKNNKWEISQCWEDLVIILRDKKIELGKYVYGSPEDTAFSKRCNNLNKFLKTITWKNLVTKKRWLMELPDVKKL